MQMVVDSSLTSSQVRQRLTTDFRGDFEEAVSTDRRVDKQASSCGGRPHSPLRSVCPTFALLLLPARRLPTTVATADIRSPRA